AGRVEPRHREKDPGRDHRLPAGRRSRDPHHLLRTGQVTMSAAGPGRTGPRGERVFGGIMTPTNLIARRWFLQQCGIGLGGMALAHLFGGDGHAAPVDDPLAPRAPHFAPKAKRVIYLFMAGAPSHLELFDYKPKLAQLDGKLPPADLLKGYRAAFLNPNSRLPRPRFQFEKQGQCGP